MKRGKVSGFYTFEADVSSVPDEAERRMDALQRMVWEVVINPLWLQRNDLLHKQKNRYHNMESEKLGERIAWYTKHKQDLLSVHDHHLARFDISTIHRMRRQMSREWICH